MSSINERPTVTKVEPDDSEPATERPVATQSGWLTFEAYVAWVAAMNGLPATPISPPPVESERTVEDRRSTVVVPSRRKSRRKAWSIRFGVVPESRRHRLSATVIRRVLAKTG